MTESRQNTQERVWQIVRQIPKGKVASYGQIAKLAGIPSHSRLIGRILSGLPPQYSAAMASRSQFTGKNHQPGEGSSAIEIGARRCDPDKRPRQPENLRLGRQLSPLISRQPDN